MSADLLRLVRLDRLMELTDGREDVPVALLDGPVGKTHPDLAASTIRDIRGSSPAGCVDIGSLACRHGTFVAGLLASGRGAAAPGICPGCTLLVRAIYSENERSDDVSGTTPKELAQGIAECIRAGARVVNVSGAIPSSAIAADHDLQAVLDEAARRGVIVVAASGNQASVGRSAITGHQWVLAVVPYGRDRRPLAHANLGRSIGRYGLGAPGENVTSLDPAGGSATMSGSSVSAPFVAGTAALLFSLVPTATGQEIRSALAHHRGHRRSSITPPLLDAWAAYEALVRHHPRRRGHGEHIERASS